MQQIDTTICTNTINPVQGNASCFRTLKTWSKNPQWFVCESERERTVSKRSPKKRRKKKKRCQYWQASLHLRRCVFCACANWSAPVSWWMFSCSSGPQFTFKQPPFKQHTYPSLSTCWSPYSFIVLVNTHGCGLKQYGNQFCISILMQRTFF